VESQAAAAGSSAPGACTCLQWSDVYGAQGLDCNPGFGGLAGGEFCNFIHGFRSNACLQRQFMTDAIVSSVCYVSPDCQGSAPASGGFNLKTCSPGADVVLAELPIADTTALALRLGVDQGVVAGYSTAYLDRLTRTLKPEELQRIKASGTPTFIWSMKSHFADRWAIKGNQVWVHKFDPKAKGYWRVSCLEGCD